MEMIDPNPLIETLNTRIAAECDARVRHNLALTLKHIVDEISGDAEGAMATMCADPVHHIHGVIHAGGGAREVTLDGDAIRAAYTRGVARGVLQAQDLRIQNIAADRNTVVVEARVRIARDGEALHALGYAVEPHCNYLYDGMVCIVFPFDEAGMIRGENVYMDPRGFEDIADRPVLPEAIGRIVVRRHEA